jgi:hypothetical protein
VGSIGLDALSSQWEGSETESTMDLKGNGDQWSARYAASLILPIEASFPGAIHVAQRAKKRVGRIPL